MNGAESLQRTLLACGVDTCFMNPGTSEMHFVAALDNVPGMRSVLALFEGVVTGAADGYGRMTGKPAATLLHLGPGLANGMANLHNARRAGTPIVNIVGDHATYHRKFDAPLTSDAEGMAKTVSKWVKASASAGEVGRDTAEAVARSMELRRGVATLVLPADTAWGDAEGVAEPIAPAVPPAVDAEAVERAAKALSGAGRRVLSIGGDALRDDGLEAAARIAAKTGAEVYCDTIISRVQRGAGRAKIRRLPYFPEAVEKTLTGTDELVLAGTRSPVAFFAYPGKSSDLTPAGVNPNLDRLHGESTRFTRFLVSPTCSPTRAAIMTGRHPMKNGVTHTILERERMTLDATILPQVLKTADYTTGIFGKWHLGDEEEYQPHSRGFDEAFIHGAGGIGQAYNCSCADAPGNKYFDPAIRHNGSFVKTKGYCTDLFFTAALGWINKVKDEDDPFFAYITTNAPHGPFIAPPKNTKRFTDRGFKKTQAGFYGMIENIDENMGRLLEKLKEWNLEESTVLIFMSDNGMTGGGSGRGVLGKTADGKPMEFYNAGMKGMKGSTDEGGVRVPFFIRCSSLFKAGQDIDRIAAHIDLLPTFAELAGAEIPKGQVEGRSLYPLLKNPKAEWPDRYFFTHKARWKTGAEPNEFQWKTFAVRNQRYRFVNGTALYDMEKDPGQTENIIDANPEVVTEMKKAYDAFWKETRPLMVNEEAPMSKTRPYHVLFNKQVEEGGIPDWVPPKF